MNHDELGISVCVSGAAKIRINILNKFLSLNTRIGSFSLFTYDMISLDRETRVVLVNFYYPQMLESLCD